MLQRHMLPSASWSKCVGLGISWVLWADCKGGGHSDPQEGGGDGAQSRPIGIVKNRISYPTHFNPIDEDSTFLQSIGIYLQDTWCPNLINHCHENHKTYNINSSFLFRKSSMWIFRNLEALIHYCCLL
jgi:hypothetical protein